MGQKPLGNKAFSSPTIQIGTFTLVTVVAERETVFKGQEKPLQWFAALLQRRQHETFASLQWKSCALFFHQSPLKIVKASGVHMYDEHGHEYLDCINNVAHVGHCHPHVTKAAIDQMQLLYTNSRYLHDNIVMYAKRLISYFPKELNVCYFVNSGSEANDLALRLARAHTNHKDVIVLDGAYHGNLISMTDLSPLKFEKIPGGKKKFVHVAPLPCSYRGKYTKERYMPEEIGAKYADEVALLINNAHEKGRKIAAFIAESMVSCGGQVVLPEGYLKAVYSHVREAGGVVIADEVQTGFGRCGNFMWAFQLQGNDVIPDIVTVGKPMGNGHPVSAVITTKEIAESFKNLGISYFNTFGGNPVSMAIANAVLDIIENESLCKNAINVSNHLLKELEILKAQHSIIGDVRGVGLFLGIDLVKNAKTKEPATEEATLIVERMKDKGVIISTEGKFENVLKFKPPMTFSVDDANYLVSVLHNLLCEIESQERGQSEFESVSDSHCANESNVTDKETTASVSSSCSVSSSIKENSNELKVQS